MKRSQLIKQLEDNRKAGKHLTLTLLKSLSPKFAERVSKSAESQNLHFSVILYNYLFDRPKCKSCGGLTTFKSFHCGYYEYCSCKCTQADEEVRKKLRSTMVDRHGVEYTGQSAVLRKKMRKTLVARYGKLGMKSEAIVKKREATTKERYGVTHLLKDPERVKIMQNTMCERTGYYNAQQDPKARAKTVKTNRKKLGVDYPMQSAAVQEKHKKTMMAKWGVPNALSSPVIRAKILETMKAKYGVEYLLQDPDYLEAFQDTLYETYGVRHPFQSEVFKEKFRSTMIMRYGVTSSFQCKELHDRFTKTMVERYGVPYAMQNRESFEKQQLAGFAMKRVKLEGRIFHVRGYEDYALRFLVKSGCKVEDIAVSKSEGMPSIKYKDGKKTRMYHPDIYAKVDGKWMLIEVKGTYTLGINKGDHQEVYARIKRKARACLEAGYIFRLLVVDPKKGSIFVKNFHRKLKSEVRSELSPLLQPRSRQP